MLSGAFAGLGEAVARAVGAPYADAIVRTSTDPVYDDGGSIITPGEPVERTCLCQVDAATDAMRQDVGFVQGDVRLLILALDGALDTDAQVEAAGERYSVQAVTRDPAGIGWDCRGRRVA